jgi:mannose-6-phosphate isomerase-like protein (cupin superfamily)
MPTPFHGNIEELTLANDNFRQVIFTAPHCQLVLMSIKVGGEIGVETHTANDQFFRFEQGEGKAVIAGKEYEIKNGTAILVPSGTEHNIINTGSVPLKLYTVYSPAHHIDGRIHANKEDAVKDVEDEEFGNNAS